MDYQNLVKERLETVTQPWFAKSIAKFATELLSNMEHDKRARSGGLELLNAMMPTILDRILHVGPPLPLNEFGEMIEKIFNRNQPLHPGPLVVPKVTIKELDYMIKYHEDMIEQFKKDKEKLEKEDKEEDLKPGA